MGQLDLQLAKEMVNNYAETRKKLIDQAYGINDTTSIWFSIDEFKAFAATLTSEASGVRIYLGVYDNDYPKTPDQTTVIAIGTAKDTYGNDVDPILGYTIAWNPVAFNQGKACPPFCSPPPPPPLY